MLVTTTSSLSNLLVQLELEQKGLKTASPVTGCCLRCERWSRLWVSASLFISPVISLKQHIPLRKALEKRPQSDQEKNDDENTRGNTISFPLLSDWAATQGAKLQVNVAHALTPVFHQPLVTKLPKKSVSLLLTRGTQ